jgi:Major Facilitator Superfamily
MKRIKRMKSNLPHFLRIKSKDVIPSHSPDLLSSSHGMLTEYGCFLAYLCSTTVNNLPVVLIPVALTEEGGTNVLKSGDVASYVASVASMAVLGSALGKLVNGFVCEALGNQRASFLYMLGLSLCTHWLSLGQLTYAYAGMEFFASLQWTALSVLLSKRYASDLEGYHRGIGIMSLASTGGQFMTKTVAVVLLQYYSWNAIASAATYLAMLAGLIVLVFLPEEAPPLKGFDFQAILLDTKNIMSSRLFWVVGVAHSASMLGRGSDRVMGAFFHQATQFSPAISGGFTLSSTFGLLYGLRLGRKFGTMDGKRKEMFMNRRYIGAVLSTISLAICAHFAKTMQPNWTALWICISAFGLTANTATLFFSIPNIVASTFSSEAVCLSTLDAIGFAVAASMWKCFGMLASMYNFSASWLLLGVILVSCRTLMIPSMRPILYQSS